MKSDVSTQPCHLENPEDPCLGEILKRNCGHYACETHSDALDAEIEGSVVCEECINKLFDDVKVAPV